MIAKTTPNAKIANNQPPRNCRMAEPKTDSKSAYGTDHDAQDVGVQNVITAAFTGANMIMMTL